MDCQRGLHRFGILFPKLGAALDVGEEKSDGSARESGHARSVLPNPGNAESVPGQSEQVRTTLLTHARTMAVLASIWATKKALAGLFKRMKGLELSTFCMASGRDATV